MKDSPTLLHLLVPLVLLPLAGLQAGHDGLARFKEATRNLRQRALTPVFNERVDLAFAPDDSRLIHTVESAEGRTILVLDPSTNQQLATLKPGFAWKTMAVGDQGNPLLETRNGWRQWDGTTWVDGGAPKRGSKQKQTGARHTGWESKDGRFKVSVDDGQLVLHKGDDPPRVLIRREEGFVFRDAPVWSPDGTRFAIWRTKDVEERTVQLVESSPKDQVQPKRSTYVYPKPGDEIDTRAPWVCFVDDREPLAPELSLIPHPYSCDKLAWRKDGHRLTYEWIERGFGKYHVIEVNSETRQQRILVCEESDAFIFVYENTFRHDLDDGREILWMSERDGWRHLYLLDGTDGSVKRQLTKGPWVVREVVDVDERNRQVLIQAGGYHEGQDPYLIHYLRVGIDDGSVVPLTESNGTHDRFERSPGGNYYTCRWSRVDHAPVTELRRWSDGKRIRVLAEADASNLLKNWKLPYPLVAKDRDGKDDIHGFVILPRDFDETKKYPVLEMIYAGPQGAFVPKKWGPWMGSMHQYAAQGFIVVQIDGRGTNYRSREFHQVAYKNLKDAGIPDRIAWMKEATKTYPQMDLERVGIYGGSAGGQNAMAALLFHGDFYKAAAADCGCHDNRMDKLWWNEQWMDWPVDESYGANSNVVHAHQLKGALFLSVGELDNNVDPSSTYQVVNALVEAGKDFEFLMLPGKGHGSGELPYGSMRRLRFFQRHLGGPE
jgi:dipeptidyl aminopeptidase/acylaminoacyl peptidase